jgi:ABC-type transport system substrate-binding protein
MGLLSSNRKENSMASLPGLPARTLRIGIRSRLGTTDPSLVKDSDTHMGLEPVYETPFAGAGANEPPVPILFSEPLRAESNGLVLSAAVRPGITFSDGTPCTAETISASLKRVLDMTDRAKVQARGERVEFTLRTPDPHFSMVLTQPSYGVVLPVGGKLLGTGSFLGPEALDGGDPTQADHVVLRANPRAREKPKVDAVALDVYTDTDSLLAAVIAGDVHITYGLTSAHLPLLRGAPVYPKVLDGTSTGILFVNTERPALRDARIRRAICAAPSRADVARALFGPLGLSFAAKGLLPPFLGAETALGVLDGNPGEALKLLAEPDVQIPQSLDLLLTWATKSYLPDPPAAAKVLAEELQAVGLSVNVVVPKDRADYRSRQARGTYDLLLGGWIADTRDPADFLDSLLHSSMVPELTATRPAANNLSRWKDAKTDEALGRFRTSKNQNDLLGLYRTILEQGLLTPLLHGKVVVVFHSSLRGFRPSLHTRCSFNAIDL